MEVLSNQLAADTPNPAEAGDGDAEVIAQQGHHAEADGVAGLVELPTGMGEGLSGLGDLIDPAHHHLEVVHLNPADGPLHQFLVDEQGFVESTGLLEDGSPSHGDLVSQRLHPASLVPAYPSESSPNAQQGANA